MQRTQSDEAVQRLDQALSELKVNKVVFRDLAKESFRFLAVETNIQFIQRVLRIDEFKSLKSIQILLGLRTNLA